MTTMNQSRFVIGQRVRVRQYTISPTNPEWGNPHFVVGHFGHVEAAEGQYIDVRIERGPDGGPVDDRVRLDKGWADWNLWPMLPEELEPVD